MQEELPDFPLPLDVIDLKIYTDYWKKIRAELENSINEISDDDFIRPMPDGSWSASEIAEHLVQTQCRFARSIALLIAGRIGSDVSAREKPDYGLIEKYFKNHQKINNPESVSPVHINEKKVSLNSLKKAMDLFFQNSSRAGSDDLKKRTMEHFLFGPLNILEYTWVLVMHENHHTYLLRKKYF